jgi:glycosyltransferase involved in cell wall biosynthesis
MVMRVLIVSEPGANGSFRIVEGLAHYLIEQKHEVHLAYSNRRDGSPSRLVSFVHEHGGETMNLGVGNKPEPRDFFALCRLWALAHRIRPQVVHAHSSKAGVLARALPWLGIHAQLFYTPHGYYGLAPRSGVMPHFFNAVERVLGRTGTTIALSEGERRFALDRLRVPPEKVRIIPNPVSGETFQPPSAEERREARAELGLPQDAIVLGMMGRLTFQKDPVAIYSALPPLFADHPRLMLFHVGRGELEAEVENAARQLGNRVVRRPYLERPAVFYRAVDALALTSRYEGLPSVVLEALAAGLPVVTTMAPGVSHFSGIGLSHWWDAPLNDPPALTNAIRLWLEDLPRKRPSNHRQTVLERYSVENTLGVLLAAYRNAIAGDTGAQV